MGVAFSEQQCCSCSENAANCHVEVEQDYYFDGAAETEDQRSSGEMMILREEGGSVGGSSVGLRGFNIFGTILDQQPESPSRSQSKKPIRMRSAPGRVRTQKSLPCLLGNPELVQSESKEVMESWLAPPYFPIPPPAPEKATPLTPPPSFRDVPPVAAEAASTTVLAEKLLLGPEIPSDPAFSRGCQEEPAVPSDLQPITTTPAGKKKSALKKKQAKQEVEQPSKGASELEVVFADEHGNKIPVVIKKQPLGAKFGRQFEGGPVRVVKVMHRSYAEALGLEVGWMVVRVAGQDVAKKSFEDTQEALKNGMAALTDSSRHGASSRSTIHSRFGREGTL